MAKSTEKRAILRGDGNSRSVVQQDGSNSVQSVLNLVKVCIGTGALALPFAVNEGGLLFGTLGLLFMAAWNQYASYRLDMLRNWTGATTYASLAEVVLGPWARVLVDVCTISTLLGEKEKSISFVHERGVGCPHGDVDPVLCYPLSDSYN